MHIRKVSRWSASFLVLGLYSAFLVFSDTRGAESKAYAHDFPPAIERRLEAHPPARALLVRMIQKMKANIPPLPHTPHIS